MAEEQFRSSGGDRNPGAPRSGGARRGEPARGESSGGRAARGTSSDGRRGRGGSSAGQPPRRGSSDRLSSAGQPGSGSRFGRSVSERGSDSSAADRSRSGRPSSSDRYSASAGSGGRANSHRGDRSVGADGSAPARRQRSWDSSRGSDTADVTRSRSGGGARVAGDRPHAGPRDAGSGARNPRRDDSPRAGSARAAFGNRSAGSDGARREADPTRGNQSRSQPRSEEKGRSWSADSPRSAGSTADGRGDRGTRGYARGGAYSDRRASPGAGEDRQSSRRDVGPQRPNRGGSDRDRPVSDRERSSSRQDRPASDRNRSRADGDRAPSTGRSDRFVRPGSREDGRTAAPRFERAHRRSEEAGRPAEPALADNVDPRLLDPSVRAELRTLTIDTGDTVARHLVAAGLLVDEDPHQALAHARFARSIAARVGAVREAVGIAAYHAEEWAEALSELRAARRISGDSRWLAVTADCERALGHPDRALKALQDPELARLDPQTQIEVLIVVAGARRDLGQSEAALAVLDRAKPDRSRPRAGSSRLWYAYADVLSELGREDEAKSWFAAVAGLDEDETDAAERAGLDPED